MALDHPWTGLCLAVVLYGLLLGIYRLTLHPLASFPGPKFAASTFWCEFYHDVVRGGQYVFEIGDMHRRYGPIVRITPDELHCCDPAFVPELMPAGKHHRNKYYKQLRVFGFAEATGATADHKLHKPRRAAMSKMFSKESIRRLEPIMKDNLARLITRLEHFQQQGDEISLLPMFGAFTNDTISEYAYGFNSNWLENKEFNAPFFRMIDGFHDFGHLAMQFPWFLPMLNMLPIKVMQKLNPGMSSFMRFKQELIGNIRRVARARAEGKPSNTVFDEIFDSRLSEYDKSEKRLLQEAQNISIAGTESTSWTVSVTVFHLLSNPSCLAKLRTELREAFPGTTTLTSMTSLEQLPYLNAVIHEGLRLALGTSNRKARLNPDGTMRYFDARNGKEWIVPRNYPVSMATPLVHLNPDVFENPDTFDPERFIVNPSLKKSIISFSWGARQCLGMQLAFAEMFMLHGTIWRHFGCASDKGEKGWLELFETDRSNVTMVSDRFVPGTKKDSKGIRIMVKK